MYVWWICVNSSRTYTCTSIHLCIMHTYGVSFNLHEIGYSKKNCDPDMIWTCNLLIWSQTRYHCTTGSSQFCLISVVFMLWRWVIASYSRVHTNTFIHLALQCTHNTELPHVQGKIKNIIERHSSFPSQVSQWCSTIPCCTNFPMLES